MSYFDGYCVFSRLNDSRGRPYQIRGVVPGGLIGLTTRQSNDAAVPIPILMWPAIGSPINEAANLQECRPRARIAKAPSPICKISPQRCGASLSFLPINLSGCSSWFFHDQCLTFFFLLEISSIHSTRFLTERCPNHG